MSGIRIIGMGHALPERRVANGELTAYMDTSDEWIRTRTGIRERRICGPGESQCRLAVSAAKEALERSGADPDEIGLVIAATSSPDYLLPSTACLVMQELGIPSGIPAFDLNAACTGFIYALQTADAFLSYRDMHPESRADGERPLALLIGAEQYSDMLDFSDRETSILFGDGAAAAVVRREAGIRFFSHTAAEGNREALSARCLGRNQLTAAGEGGPVWAHPDEDGKEALLEEAYLHMNGRQVFRFATGVLAGEIRRMERVSGVRAEDTDGIVCHQANRRIIDHVRRQMHLGEELFPMNLDVCGNTSAASIPLLLYELIRGGKIRAGSRIFCVGFGAGLTWGSAYLEF